jgi:molecular chaperone GrpE (heat shock protein)
VALCAGPGPAAIGQEEAVIHVLFIGLVLLAVGIGIKRPSIWNETRHTVLRWWREASSRAAIESIDQRLKNLSQHVEAVRGLAEERGREIERLRDGYDFALTRSFARGVIKAIDLVQEFKEQLSRTHGKRKTRLLSDALRRLDATESQLVFLLEAHQIELFTPAPGDSIEDDSQRFEPVESRPAESPSDVGRVIEVKSPGYVLVLGDSKERVIRPAKVSVSGALDHRSAPE